MRQINAFMRGFPIIQNLRLRLRVWLVVCLLGAGTASWAVDPPPASILHAPRAQQLQYTKRLAEESEHLRAQVALRRFQEREYRRQLIASGMAHELAQHQREMVAQENGEGAAESSAEATFESNTAGPRIGWFTTALLVALPVLIYKRWPRS